MRLRSPPHGHQRHDHASAGGADRVAIYRHSQGDYIHRAWGVDPDHGEFDKIRWVPAEKGPSLIEGIRAADEALYANSAGERRVRLWVVLALGGVVALIVLWVMRASQ